MAPVTWPTGIAASPSDFSPGIVTVGEIAPTNRSGLTQVVQGRQLRTAAILFDLRDLETAARLEALLENLEGKRGTVAVPWFGYTAKLGNGTGSPTVNGAHSAGTSTLATTGWTGSDPRLKQGAMVSLPHIVNGVSVPFIYRLLADVNGAAPNLTLRPRLRFDVAGGAAITYNPDPVNGTWLTTTMQVMDSSFGLGHHTADLWIEGLPMTFIETIRDAY